MEGVEHPYEHIPDTSVSPVTDVYLGHVATQSSLQWLLGQSRK